LHNIIRWENETLRRTQIVPRQQNEEFGHWRRRHTQQARKVFHSLGHKSLATVYIETLHKRAGHYYTNLATFVNNHLHIHPQTPEEWQQVLYNLREDNIKIPDTPASCLPALAILCKDEDWWCWRQAFGRLNLLQGRWRHNRRGSHLRWEHTFTKTFGLTWKSMATTKDWSSTLPNFISAVYQQLKIRPREQLFPERNKQPHNADDKPRLVIIEPKEWRATQGKLSIEILGDNRTMVQLLNGTWAAKKNIFQKMFAKMHQMLHFWHTASKAQSRTPWAPWARHVYRELNTAADELSKAAIDKIHISLATLWHIWRHATTATAAFKCFFDGSEKDGTAGAGWCILFTLQTDFEDEPQIWMPLAECSLILEPCTAAEAEAQACLSLVMTLNFIITGQAENIKVANIKPKLKDFL